MENKFKYRPTVKSIEDLQPGDEFLVGDGRWMFTGETERANLTSVKGLYSHSYYLARDLIRANVPIERDIPYPEGGAEKWELREGAAGEVSAPGQLYFSKHALKWEECYGCLESSDYIHAIPKAKPAPKEYTVGSGLWYGFVNIGDDFNPGDRVTVQRVEK